MTRAYDAIVIGTGEAGPPLARRPLARRLAAAGQRVAIVERKLLGGACVNTGCVPTKRMVASAYGAHFFRHAAEFGVETGASVNIDIKRVKARKDGVSANLRDGRESSLKSLANGTVYRGRTPVSSHLPRSAWVAPIRCGSRRSRSPSMSAAVRLCRRCRAWTGSTI